MVALFLYVSDTPDDRPRFRQFFQDCLRDAVAVARARTGSRDLAVLVIDRDSDCFESATAKAQLSGICNDPFVSVSILAKPESLDAGRCAAMMVGCELGGIVGPRKPSQAGSDPLLDLAVRCSNSLLRTYYLPPDIPNIALETIERAARTWLQPGSIMLGLPSILRGATAKSRTLLGGDRAPPIMWINLDRCDDRRRFMEAQLEAFCPDPTKGPCHRRVHAIDGSDRREFAERVMQPSNMLEQDYAPAACTSSHVLAMSAYLEEFPEEPWAIVLEDDASFEFVPRWRETLPAYLDEVPDHCGVVQLGGILCGEIDRVDVARAVPRAAVTWFSTVAYAIRREAAEDLVRGRCRTIADKVVIDLRERPPGSSDFSAENFIYGDFAYNGAAGVNTRRHPSCYFLPLFNYVGSTSTINSGNPTNHAVARGYVETLWKTNVVVAHYQEDVSWLLPLRSRCTIYDKCERHGVSSMGFREVLALPNVGREAHTYLHHILRMAEIAEEDGDDDDVVVFVQGDIRDHMSPGQRQPDHSGAVAWIRTIAAQARASPRGVSDNAVNYPIPPGFTLPVEYGPPDGPPLDRGEADTLPAWLNLVRLEDAAATPERWYCGACFAATRAALLGRRREKIDVWRRAIATLTSSSNALEAHFMERAWWSLLQA